MKHTQHLRPLATKIRQKMLLFIAFICLSQVSFGQLMPPNAAHNEYPYPGPAATAGVTNSHCYSRAAWWGCVPAGTTPWLLVNSWEFGGVSGFAWQVMDQVTFAAYEQGFIMMPAGATDLNVGIINAGAAGYQIDISYYQAGVGHFVDVYDWNCPTVWGGLGGIVFNFSLQLSCLPMYTRISMDSHKGYGTAIVWEDPTAGTNEIHAIAANLNVFGPVFRIAGTAGHMIPEVAFVHDVPQLDIHVVSFDPGGGNIEEYFVPWPTMIIGGAAATACGVPGLCAACPVPLPRTLVDVNPLAGVVPNSLHIDAPDHYGTPNWAYVYEVGGDIFCRVNNPNIPPWVAPAMGGIATVCFTNGFYAAPFYPACCPMPIINPTSPVPVNNTVPVICWDQQAQPQGGGPVVNQQSFYVAWHTTFNDAAYNPASDAYIAIQVNEDGLIRAPLPMPFNWFGASAVPGNISPTPSVALSEANETMQLLYATFAENVGGNYTQHRWVPWNVGSFKPGHGTPEPAKHYEVKVNPNPFNNDISIDFPHEIEDERVMVKVTDMQGKEYGTYNNIMIGANDFLSGVAKKLVPGNYNISVECSRIQLQQSFKVTKLD